MYYNNNGFGEDVKLKIGGPGLPDVPAPGKTVAAQARAHQYKDLYRDIQAMREAEFRKEMGEGRWNKEFVNVGKGKRAVHDRWKKEFDGYSSGGFGGWLAGLGQAATKKPISTTMLIVAGIAAYFLFFKKKKAKKVEAPKKVEKEVVEEVVEETPEEEVVEEVVAEAPEKEEAVPATTARRKRSKRRRWY